MSFKTQKHSSIQSNLYWNRSSLGQRESRLLKQATSYKRFISYEIFYDRTRKRWHLIHVTAWAITLPCYVLDGANHSVQILSPLLTVWLQICASVDYSLGTLRDPLILQNWRQIPDVHLYLLNSPLHLKKFIWLLIFQGFHMTCLLLS